MIDWNDPALLTAFVREQSEPAFGELVRRYVNLVYSVALRQTGQPAAAEEVTQAVFIVLSRKSPVLAGKRQASGSETSLSGWLYQTARLTAANYLRTEARRVRREQEAYMQAQREEPTPDMWPQIAPLLDDALGQLGARDRHAIALRFFENKSLGEIGTALGASEAAARMRVNRALEKLRKFFHKRGVTLTAAMIAGAVSAHSVHAAPTHLAVTIATTAVQGAATGSSTLTLAKGALKLMAWTKAKMAVGVVAGVLLAAGVSTMVVQEVKPHLAPERYFLNLDTLTLRSIPPKYFIIRPSHFNGPNPNHPTTCRGDTDRAIGRWVGIKTMIEYAYSYYNGARTVLPAAPFPEQHYDFLVTVPGALEKLQAEIANRYGYTAHKEVRNTDVWVLKVKNPHPARLQPNPDGMENHRPNLFIDGTCPFTYVTDRIEYFLQQPVVDTTGLQGKYDVRLDWKEQNFTPAAKKKLRQAVLDQLGLELVPTNLPVEMFVIEATK